MDMYINAMLGADAMIMEQGSLVRPRPDRAVVGVRRARSVDTKAFDWGSGKAIVA